MNLERLRSLLSDAANQLETVVNGALSESGEIREFNEIEQEEVTRLENRCEELKKMIERSEKIQADKQRAKKLDEVVNKAPDVQVVREHNHNENGEYRGYKELGNGGLGMWLKDVAAHARGKKTSKEFEELNKVTRAALGSNETVGAEGGFLPQSDHAVELQNNSVKAGGIASECRIIRTDRPYIEMKLLDETSRATGSRFGGVRVYRRKEAESVTATQPKFRRVDMKVEALEGLYYATDEELDDVPYLESVVGNFFVDEMAWKIDDEIIGGTGAGENLGIINAPCTIEVAKEGGQTADTVVYANADNMVDKILVSSRANAKWYAHADVAQQLRNAVHTPGSNTDFKPFVPAGAMGSEVDTLLSKPVKYIEQARALGDVGDFFLADFKQYALIIRTGIKASSSIHVQFLTSQKTFKWTQRVIGQPLHASALTDAYGSNTRSPFVTLAARA